METINERIQLIINEGYNRNVSAFCRDVGVKQPTMNTILGERKSKPSFDVINAIATNTNVNSEWLITGNGPMLKPSQEDRNLSQVSGTVYGGAFVGYGSASNETHVSESKSNYNKEPDQLKEVKSLKTENKKLVNEIESLKAEMNMLRGENRLLREQLGLGERKESSKTA